MRNETTEQMDESEFVQNLGLLCPVCRYDSTEFSGQPETLEGKMLCEAHCSHCDASWTEYYHLVGYDMNSN